MSLPRFKAFLTLLMAIGAATYFGGGGTLASFSAETTNGGSTAASGTLTMTDQVNSATACLSAGANSQNNFNEACGPMLTLSNLAPGAYGGTAKITVKNTGSIDGSKLWLWAPAVNATLNGALTLNATVTNLTVTGLEGTVASGDSIVVSYGTQSQTFVANAPAVGGATTISVTSATANASYPIGATVQDSSGNTTPSNTDCYDAKTTVSGSAGSTKGTDLNFNPTTGNPLCSAALLYVQETTGGLDYCWYGNTTGAPSGACAAPISVNLSSALGTGGAITALPVAALNGNVSSGDSIVVTYVSGTAPSTTTNTQTFTASANAYVGATSISVASATPTYAFPAASTVTDSTVLGTLNSDTTDTISRFDTLNNGSVGKIQLIPLTANGTKNATSQVALAAGGSRTFVVGVYLPAGTGNAQNQLQGLLSTFGMTWHVDQ